MTGLDTILEESMLHEDHIEVMTEDFECIDSFADTDLGEEEYPDDQDNIEDDEEEDEDYV